MLYYTVFLCTKVTWYILILGWPVWQGRSGVWKQKNQKIKNRLFRGNRWASPPWNWGAESLWGDTSRLSEASPIIGRSPAREEWHGSRYECGVARKFIDQGQKHGVRQLVFLRYDNMHRTGRGNLVLLSDNEHPKIYSVQFRRPRAKGSKTTIVNTGANWYWTLFNRHSTRDTGLYYRIQ